MNLKSDYQDFKSKIDQRGIQYLIHFTRFESVTAIVGERRILPRNQLHNISYDWRELVIPNSSTRLDNPKHLNTSIMHPNIYLLNIFRDKWYPGSRFCIIGINPEYIYEEKTQFSITNATYKPAIKFGIKSNIQTFDAMFMEQVSGKWNKSICQHKITVRKSTLADFYTTDPEAEVLIESEIPYNDILFIACRNQYEHDILASAFYVLELPMEKFCVQPTLFEPRSE
ncbi:MAG: DarT ssDNA thymidine ADP-ribosyltransferase family protein [Calothrix sp. MO_167.B42]|nr:DarT ssDNA thymidine ADP-ribosyltransferase family protein [Calothrix sp. MO_167.B42]